jgi:hypothetical protein
VQSSAAYGLELGPDYLFQKAQGRCFVSVDEDDLELGLFLFVQNDRYLGHVLFAPSSSTTTVVVPVFRHSNSNGAARRWLDGENG